LCFLQSTRYLSRAQDASVANREDSVALAHRRLGHKLYAVNDSVHLARKRLGIPEPSPAQQSAPERDQLKKESPGVRGAASSVLGDSCPKGWL
jgi:hypothetical protein